MSYSRILHDETTAQRSIILSGQRANTWSRWAPLVASCIATALSTVPIGLQWNAAYTAGDSPFYDFVDQDRATIQVLVSIIASILGLLWTWSVCATVGLVMRPILARRDVSMEDFRLHVSIVKKIPDIHLSSGWFVLSAFCWIVGLIPARLWTGALTPQVTSIPIIQQGVIPVPLYSDETVKQYPITPTEMTYVNCTVQTPSNGTFTNCPARIYSGRIVDSMRSASAVNGTARTHMKLDNTIFSYRGRSFGAGTSVGLHDLPQLGRISSYSFKETVLMSNSSCVYNSSSAWGEYTKITGEEFIPKVYQLVGRRPNTNMSDDPQFYQQLSWGDNGPDNIVSFSAGSCCGFNNGTPPYQLSIAAGWDPSPPNLDKLQCELTLKPTIREITVSLINHTIHVDAVQDADAALSVPDIAHQSDLIEWLLTSLQSITKVETSLYVSTVGEALRSNIHNKLHNDKPEDVDMDLLSKNPSNSPNTTIALAAISESIEAALDDILEILNGFALTNSTGHTPTDAIFHVAVVVMGSPGYNYAIFLVNLLAFAGIAGVAVYTRLFADSPAFDFSDLPSVLLASLYGTATTATTPHSSAARAERILGSWDGHAGDHGLRDLLISTRFGNNHVPGLEVRRKGEQKGIELGDKSLHEEDSRPTSPSQAHTLSQVDTFPWITATNMKR